MKIFDINTSVGHWPFRKLTIETIPELQEHLSRRGISGAAVVNTNAVFYKNCHDANLELCQWIGSDNDFFTAIATINPFYAKWDKDLTEAVRKLRCKGVRLLPQYHDYDLDSLPEELPRLATALNIPIFIPHRLVDIRQRHWLDTEKTIGLNQVYNLCRRCPETDFVYTEAMLSVDDFAERQRCRNLFLETSRLRSTCGQMLSQIAARIGDRQLLFGSGSPFKETLPALLKLQHADLAAKEKEAIACNNAAKVLAHRI